MLGLDFKLNPLDNPESRNECLQVMLWALVIWDQRLIRAHRKQGTPLPGIYTAGIRYQSEPEGSEEWLDIPAILQQNWGDCEELAAWRVAELRDAGIQARPAWRHRRVQSEDTGKEYSMYHIVVAVPSSTAKGGYEIEDPSAKLGMGKGQGA